MPAAIVKKWNSSFLLVRQMTTCRKTRRAEKEVKDVADGLYDGRIEKYENGKGMRI